MVGEVKSATPRRPYRLGKRADASAATRRRILDAAWHEIEGAGYRSANIDAIAARAGVTRITVYRHFPTRSALFEAVAWDQVGRARLDRLDAARAHPDVAEATRRFLLENCSLFADVGPILRAMFEIEREDPEVARVLGATYRGRRLASLRELADRIAESGRANPAWTPEAVFDALSILTSLEAFETLTRTGKTAAEAGEALFALAGGFLARPKLPGRSRRPRLS